MTEEKHMKPFLCVDFDGVLNNYKGYDEDYLGTPREGAAEFLQTLSQKYTVIILSSRRYSKIIKWLQEYELLDYVGNVTSIKYPAVAYIDDRGIQFNGDYDKILQELEDFTPYWVEE